jgi:hypothetical protein
LARLGRRSPPEPARLTAFGRAPVGSVSVVSGVLAVAILFIAGLSLVFGVSGGRGRWCPAPEEARPFTAGFRAWRHWPSRPEIGESGL